jgi:hypothetical protein
VDLDRIGLALAGAVRDTDLVGWYAAPHTIGMLLTTLGDSPDRVTLREILTARVAEAVRTVSTKRWPPDLRISFHFFPEDDAGGPAPTLDEHLYPDLQAKRASRLPSAKRIVDILGSLLALTLLSPLCLTIAVFIKLSSPGPVLFRQTRLGRLGKQFTFLKFRSMHVGNDDAIHKR